jgi:hypothetical protein
VLHIDAIDALEAGATTATCIRYEPSGFEHAPLVLDVSPGVRIESVAAALLSGEPITSRVDARPGGVSVDLGGVDVPIVLTAAVRADVPSTAHRAVLSARVRDQQTSVGFAVFGEPRFLTARCKWSVSEVEAAPGGTVSLSLSCVNDGSADAAGVRAYLRLPPGVTVEAPADCWREVDTEGRRYLVLPIERVAIGERVTRELTVRVAPIAVDGTAVAFDGWLAVAGRQFALDGTALAVRSAPRVVGRVRVVDTRTYRYGDRVTAIVSVKSRGTDVARDVCVRVGGRGIAWEGAGRDGSLAITFGDLPPFSESSFAVEGVVVGSPAGKRQMHVSLRGVASFGSFPVEPASIAVAGASRVVADLGMVGPDAGNAHTVELRVSNVGDGVARSVRVVAEPIEGVVGVVDSLVVDGAARLELDGSLAVDRGGVDLGRLEIRTERRLCWRVRSVAAQRVVMRVRVLVDGEAVTAQAEAELVAGRARPASVPSMKGEPLRVVDVSSQSSAAEEPARTMLEAVPTRPGAVAGEEAVEAIVAEAALVDDGAAQPLRYDLPARAPARWSAWFGEAGPQGGTLLGMHALALREFLPVAAASAPADAALAGIRSEVEAVVQARLESYKVLGVFGASGWDFTTARLRAAVTTLYALLDRPLGELDGLGLERAICALTGADATALAEPVAQYRDAVLAALDRAVDLAALGDPAPEVAASARALFDQLVEVAVP